MTDTVSQEPLRARQLIEPGELTVTSEREGAVYRVGLSGELDVATADAVHDELMRVDASDADSLVVDLSGLTFIDSTGLCVLSVLPAGRAAGANRLTLLRGGAAVQRAVALTGLESHLRFAD